MKLENFYNEDCKLTIERFENNSLDLIVTSPPYYNTKEYSHYDSVEIYLQEMSVIFKSLFEKLKDSRMCVINISPIIIKRDNRQSQSKRVPLPFYFVPMMESIGFEFLEDIIWVKPQYSVPNRNATFFRNRKPLAYKPNNITEYILVFKKSCNFLLDKIIKNQNLIEGDYERTNVWYMNPVKNWHPAPYPIELVERIVKYYSYENEYVYDPFGGSGSTAKACINLNRNWYMSELNSTYYENATKDILEIKNKLF